MIIFIEEWFWTKKSQKSTVRPNQN